MTTQIVRDWVLRINAEGPVGLIDRRAPGKAPLLQAERCAPLAAAVEKGPKPYFDGVVRWRLVDLVQWLWEHFGLSVRRQTLGRELRAMGGTMRRTRRPRTISETPGRGRGHPVASPRRHARRALVQDEARLGQKNKITHRGARRGTRPRAPHDQRTDGPTSSARSAQKRARAGLVMPYCDTPAMQAHLREISAALATDAHAVLILDQAGWRFSGRLVVPDKHLHPAAVAPLY